MTMLSNVDTCYRVTETVNAQALFQLRIKKENGNNKVILSERPEKWTESVARKNDS
jgi:hypothetical protein